MTRATVAGGLFVAVVAVLAAVAGRRALNRHVFPALPAPPLAPSSEPSAAPEAPASAATYQGFLYGRITTPTGAAYQGRLRFGGDQEAFWSDTFNGYKDQNPWLAHVPPERFREESRAIEIFGIRLARKDRQRELGRPFMTRCGDIARIEARGDRVLVTLKSGTVFDLNRFDASDFDDGLRVWDDSHGVVDLDSLQVRTIEPLPTPALSAAPHRLHGTVRTRQGDFTGFVGWNREDYVGSDELDGRTAAGELRLRFDTVRSITRRSRDSAQVALVDGSELVLSDSADVGDDSRGIYVADPRYGRLLISWDAFERVDFSAPGQAGSGPGYGDFPPGRPLTGSVVTSEGRRLAGRLVYDLDESETTETLDAPSEGVDYTIPFDLIAAIALPGGGEQAARHATPHARVTLRSGEQLQLERSGDLGEGNAGLLVFLDGQQTPEYVPWTDIERIDFDGPPAASPPLGR